MKNFKKITCLALALVFALALCACGETEHTPSDNQDGTQGNDNPNPTPNSFEGTIELTLPDGKKVTATADVDDYFISTTDTFYAIFNKNDSTDATFAKIAYIDGKTAEDLAPSYIETEVGEFENLEFSGTVEIGQDGIYADLSTASNDSQYVEAYLANVDGGVVAVLISVSSELKDTELSVLKNLVNSLTIA